VATVYIRARRTRGRASGGIWARLRHARQPRNTNKPCNILNGIDSFGGIDKQAREGDLIMVHMLVRHKVADFAKWKPVYDAHGSARQNAGLKEEHLLRNVDDPNEVILLFSAEDLEKAKTFAASDDLRQAMQKAGVSDKPDVYFLK
jgi:heme-degrading monooxygenase HmoA